MEKKGSLGIILCGIFSIVIAFSGCYSFFVIANGYERLVKSNIFPKWFIIYGIISLPILVIMFIISGIGILQMKSWGRRMLLYLCSYYLITKLISLSLGLTQKTPTGKPLNLIIYFGFYLSIIYYLTRSKVKEQFE